MSKPESRGSSPRIRMRFFVIGSVLWVLVAGIGAYALWKSNASRSREVATAGRPGPQPRAGAEDAGGGPALRIPGEGIAAGSREPIVITPQVRTQESDKPWSPDGVADFQMMERSGRIVTNKDLLGKPWAVCFIFTRCVGTCPKITSALAKLQEEVKDLDVRLVSITVDPETDTPERLKGFAASYGADPERWLFLSGDKLATYRLIQNSFKLPVQEAVGKDRIPGYEVLHSNKIALVDALGRVQGMYNGTDDVDMAKLRHALEASARLAKQSRNETASALETRAAFRPAERDAAAGRTADPAGRVGETADSLAEEP